jgi:transposase
MGNLLALFSLFDDVDISYKTIEHAYSDPLVKLIIHNMLVILVKNKEIKQVNLIGDGTGYSLTITKHYRSVREKAGESIKSNDKPKSAQAKSQTKQDKRRLFTYAFALMDLKSHLYVGYGASLKWERAAFDGALAIMGECGVEARSVRLDQYYAGQSAAAVFGADTVLYLISKSNAAIRGCYVWKDMIWDLISYPFLFLFLGECFRRENSESGFSADKRCCGWKIWQRKDDRVETTTMCKGVWHDLFWLGGAT